MEELPPTTDLASVSNSSISSIMLNVPILAQIESIATRMASAKCTVPDHLRNSEGDCYAVTMQAVQWGMNPYSVAQKTHLVNGTLGYEAQLVNAVINSLAPTKDRIHFEYFGDWKNVDGKKSNSPDVGVKAYATFKGEDLPREITISMAQVGGVRNSPLWVADPRQQLAYLAVKRWARLYCPDVILGVYSSDELMDAQPERDVSPASPRVVETPEYPAEQFVVNLPKWRAYIEAGKKTPQEIIDTVESKGTLTDDQKQAIIDCAPIEAESEVVA